MMLKYRKVARKPFSRRQFYQIQDETDSEDHHLVAQDLSYLNKQDTKFW